MPDCESVSWRLDDLAQTVLCQKECCKLPAICVTHAFCRLSCPQTRVFQWSNQLGDSRRQYSRLIRGPKWFMKENRWTFAYISHSSLAKFVVSGTFKGNTCLEDICAKRSRRSRRFKESPAICVAHAFFRLYWPRSISIGFQRSHQLGYPGSQCWRHHRSYRWFIGKTCNFIPWTSLNHKAKLFSPILAVPTQLASVAVHFFAPRPWLFKSSPRQADVEAQQSQWLSKK